MRPRHRVVITGVGPIAPNGIGKSEFSGALREGRSGIRYVTCFDTEGLTSNIGGQVDDFDFRKFFPSCPANATKSLQFALSASKMALDDADLDLREIAPHRVGAALGCTTNRYELDELEHLTTGRPPEEAYTLQPSDLFLPGATAGYLGIEGPLVNVDMACSSGNQAVVYARDIIRDGLADVVLSGGVDLPLNRLVYSAFCQVRAVSTRDCAPEAACRPFDAQRDGLILSDGAGILVVESLEHAQARGARIYAEIAGTGLTSDAHHMLIPDKSGAQMLRSMELALMDAGIPVRELDYINAHGTSTLLNDAIESNAAAKLLGKHARSVPISSIKSMIGHTLGAAGALEIIACLLSMEQDMLPPTINFEERDPNCAELDYVPNRSRSLHFDVCMSNSFAFGGSNTSIVLKRLSG